MDATTTSDGLPLQDLMEPCPRCRTCKDLHLKCDLASLSSLEYWIECSGCATTWNPRDIDGQYAASEAEAIEAWNRHAAGVRQRQASDGTD